jgi:phosphomannomutase/phosphoglucomutase
LNSSSNIEIIAKKFNSKVIRTKVGSVEVSRKMIPIDALIGFEENGGFMYGKHNQVRDGCMTLALMLDLLATSETLSKEIKNLPSSFTTKDKISCSAEKVSKLISSLKEEFPNSDITDGIKITIDSKNWVMIRPSGTEPIVRVYAESESQEKLDILMSEYLTKVKSIISR